MITREELINALRSRLEPMDVVNAMWEGGAASFGRVDDWSDLDLQVDVADGRITEVVAAIEEALQQLGVIDLRYELPQPTWHGHWQAFYHLKNSSPYHIIDLVVMENSNPNKFLQPEIHGTPVVAFDKKNIIHFNPFDQVSFRSLLRQRVEAIRGIFAMSKPFLLKEIHRGNDIEALAYYHSMALRPLIEALHIRYNPTQYNFYTRYIYYQFPHDVIFQLEKLFFIGCPEELPAKRLMAEQLLEETLAEIDLEALP